MTSARTQARQARLIAAGKCSCCGKEPLKTKRLGAKCQKKANDYSREYSRAMRRKWREGRT